MRRPASRRCSRPAPYSPGSTRSPRHSGRVQCIALQRAQRVVQRPGRLSLRFQHPDRLTGHLHEACAAAALGRHHPLIVETGQQIAPILVQRLLNEVEARGRGAALSEARRRASKRATSTVTVSGLSPTSAWVLTSTEPAGRGGGSNCRRSVESVKLRRLRPADREQSGQRGSMSTSRGMRCGVCSARWARSVAAARVENRVTIVSSCCARSCPKSWMLQMAIPSVRRGRAGCLRARVLLDCVAKGKIRR